MNIDNLTEIRTFVYIMITQNIEDSKLPRIENFG